MKISMGAKCYGPVDADTSVVDTLMEYLRTTDHEVKYLVHHPRKPMDARNCQQPGSLRVQAVLMDNTVVTSYQSQPGAIPRIELS